MCIVLYIFASRSAQFGVVVFHGSMVNWKRGWGQCVMKLMQCSCLTWIYGQLEEGVSVCHENCLVQWSSRDPWLIDGGSISQKYSV